MTGKCGAGCTNRCSIGACPKAKVKDEFDGFILDFDEDAVARRNAELAGPDRECLQAQR